MQNLEATQAMLGEAFIAVLRSLERALDDGWATEKKNPYLGGQVASNSKYSQSDLHSESF